MEQKKTENTHSKEFEEFFAEMGKIPLNDISTKNNQRLLYFIGKIEADAKPDRTNNIQFTI